MGGMLFIAYSIQTFGLSMTTRRKTPFSRRCTVCWCPFSPGRWSASGLTDIISPPPFCAWQGVGLVSLNDQLSINAGDLITLLCAVFYAAHIVSVEKLAPGKDITLLTVFQFAFAGLYSWLFSLPHGAL